MSKYFNITINLLILVWGIYPISSFYMNMNDVEFCSINSTFNFDLESVLYISVYSTLFFSIFFVISNIKKRDNFLTRICFSFFFVLNLGTGFLLFVSLTIPDSCLRKCSNNIISIIIFTSFYAEIIIFSLLVLLLIFSFLFLELIFKLIQEYIILPLIRKNLHKITLFLLTIWNGLLIWSLIYVYEKVVIALGILQIFLVFSSIILLKLKKVKYFKCTLSIVIIFGITIYFFEIFNSMHGLTIFGIISFISISFYPIYFATKKSKKILKKYILKRQLQHNKMPSEPPAIYASGEIYNYCKNLDIKFL